MLLSHQQISQTTSIHPCSHISQEEYLRPKIDYHMQIPRSELDGNSMGMKHLNHALTLNI